MKIHYNLFLDPVFSSRSPSSVGIDVAERPVVVDSPIPSIPKFASNPRRPANVLGSTNKNLYSDYMYVDGLNSKVIDHYFFDVVRTCSSSWGVVLSIYRFH